MKEKSSKRSLVYFFFFFLIRWRENQYSICGMCIWAPKIDQKFAERKSQPFVATAYLIIIITWLNSFSFASISASHVLSGNWNPNRIRQPRLRTRWASNAISKRSAHGHGTKQYLIHFTLSPVAIYPNRFWPAWCQDRRPTQRMTQMVMYFVGTFIISTLCLYRRQRK